MIKAIKILILMILGLAPTCSILSLFITINSNNFLRILMVNFFVSILFYALHEIMISVKNQYKIRSTCINLLSEYNDQKVLLKTPIAYHRHFDTLKELLSDD